MLDRESWPHVAARGQSCRKSCIAAGRLASRLTLQGKTLQASLLDGLLDISMPDGTSDFN